MYARLVLSFDIAAMASAPKSGAHSPKPFPHAEPVHRWTLTPLTVAAVIPEDHRRSSRPSQRHRAYAESPLRHDPIVQMGDARGVDDPHKVQLHALRLEAVQ